MSLKVCEQALEQLQQYPDSLSSLELQYVLHGTRASRRQLTVTTEHLFNSKLYTKMSNKVKPDPQGNIYLNSKDLSTITRDVISNIIANEMTDVDYIDSGEHISRYYPGVACMYVCMYVCILFDSVNTCCHRKINKPD